MAEQLKIGMIGCGGISGSHLPNILKTPEMREGRHAVLLR